MGNKPARKNRVTQSRELSQLQFQARVLGLAGEQAVPLLERLRFLAVFSSNLDEFFAVRAGKLFRKRRQKPHTKDKLSGLTPEQHLDAAYRQAHGLYQRQAVLFAGIERELRGWGICRVEYQQLFPEERRQVRQFFQKKVLPLLFGGEKQQPTPPEKEIYLGVRLRIEEKIGFGFLPLPANLPEVLFLQGFRAGQQLRYLLPESLFAPLIAEVFSGCEVLGQVFFAVTRDESAARNALHSREAGRREKKEEAFGGHTAAMRLELWGEADSSFLPALKGWFGVKERQIFTTGAPLRFGYVGELEKRLSKALRRGLCYPAYRGRAWGEFSRELPVTEQVLEEDALLAYPYESMEPFLRLLWEAAEDPEVAAIKITIYRLGKRSRLVDALCRAAGMGKQVTVLVELRARFEEQTNLEWSRKLQEAGCKVLHGPEKYKVHCKLCLIIRQDGFITQIGTGNYNEQTAKNYTDLSLITADREIGLDAAEFFHRMETGEKAREYKCLLLSPKMLKKTLMARIEEEIAKGAAGRIFLKLNALTDPEMIKKLREASCAGVRVRMVIRGSCCLLPGVKGETEKIQVTGIVGHFLEHSRIYCFGEGEGERMYLSSADWMPRNLKRRIEAACPVYAHHIKEKLRRLIDAAERDNRPEGLLLPNGEYGKREELPLLDSQQLLLSRIKAWDKKERRVSVKKLP